MKYQFPHIEHIDDVLPAIEGRNEFIVADREWGKVVNYMVSMIDTFPAVNTVRMANGTEQMEGKDSGPIFETNEDYLAAIRRECRGLLFYPDGRIMSRRLHKFFNINERDETQFHDIDFTQPHMILEKLDGSMITPVYTEHGIRWGTKMGITEVSMQAEVFVAGKPQYALFAEWCKIMRLTPIFEWCSRKQRIVIDYPEDRLVLIALRHNTTGEYKSFNDLIVLGLEFDIEVVKTYHGNAKSMSHLMQETKDVEGMEGYIIRFDDGHMLKIKGEWYLRIHKTKDNLIHEKNVIDLLVNEKMDDAKAFMLDDDRHRVEQFETDFWMGIAEVVRRYNDYFQTVIVGQGIDRKTWAINHLNTIKQQNPHTPGIIFGMYDGKDAHKLVVDIISRHTSTQTRIDEVRILWNNHKWNYQFEGDV